MRNDPIWRLLQDCAQELTSAGRSPFTRGDLIACVHRSDPNIAAGSINPIIQGITDNLKGGAPGAIGKNILHSIARGQFVLLLFARSGSGISIDRARDIGYQFDRFYGGPAHAFLEPHGVDELALEIKRFLLEDHG